MKLIQKGNKQLRVDDIRAEAMLKAGYVEINEKTGKPVKVADQKDALKEENKALKADNETLKAKVAELTAQLEARSKKG